MRGRQSKNVYDKRFSGRPAPKRATQNKGRALARVQSAPQVMSDDEFVNIMKDKIKKASRN